MSLIKLGGRRWSPQLVGWSRGGPGRPTKAATNTIYGLIGYVNKKKNGEKGKLSTADINNNTVDVWDISAVYSLFDGDEVIYIGEGKLGQRLSAHFRTDEFAGRWDSFSWLSPHGIDQQSEPYSITEPESDHNVKCKSLIELMELVAINLADPPGNRQNPQGAEKITWLKQLRAPTAPATIEEKLDEIMTLLKEK